MSGETINITFIDQEEPVRITVTEEPAINVNFYEIAVPDPRVSEARNDAQAAQTAAETAQAAAEAAAAEAGSAAADAVLGEATTRAAADVTLQTNIDSEATARANADALLIPLTQKASANGVASLDSAGKVPVAQLPSSIMEYQGVYNATTNSPTLSDYASGAAASDNIGNVYRVTVAGSQDFGSGSISFVVGDYVILNAAGKWEKSDTTDAVASVNGFTGVVTLGTGDVSESGGNQYHTTARAKAAAVVNSTAGSETDQAASVSAMKTYVLANVGVPADGSITKAKLATGAKDLSLAAKTSAYTLVSADELVTCDASSGAFTLTLPTAVGISGRVYIIKKTDSSLNAVTIDGNGSETIDGALTKNISTQNELLRIVSNGSNWLVLERCIPSDWASASLSTSDFTGFGTVSNISILCRRNKTHLEVRGTFTNGTSTATEARIALKYLGVAVTTADSTKIPALNKFGEFFRDTAAASTIKRGVVIASASQAYVKFSLDDQAAGASPLVAQNGSSAFSNSAAYAINFSVPVSGWES